MVLELTEDGYPESLVSSMWLGLHGDVCCTGYEPASMEGSCDNDIDVYVSLARTRLLPFLLLCTEAPHACLSMECLRGRRTN